jgi:DEAD/DEAH box helicase domain-containing protein
MQMVGIKIAFIIPKVILDALEPSKSDGIAILATLVNAEIYSPKESPVVFSGKSEKLPRILELGNDTESISWAASTAKSLAPSLLWGTSPAGEQFVRMTAKNGLSALPPQWLHVSRDALRDKGANSYTIYISKQFSGSIHDFGQKAWKHLGIYSSNLKMKLMADQPLQSLRYKDCFLKTPLSLILLKEVLFALTAYPGGATPNTFLTIITSCLDKQDGFKSQHAIHNDWQDDKVRSEVFKGLLQPIWQDFTFDEHWKGELVHYRELQLIWCDGASCSIKLDHGFGHWQTAGKVNFPFDQPVKKQIEDLKNIDFLVTTKKEETFWVIGKIEKI